MTTWRDGSSANRTAAALELADAAALHASQHAPGGTDEAYDYSRGHEIAARFEVVKRNELNVAAFAVASATVSLHYFTAPAGIGAFTKLAIFQGGTVPSVPTLARIGIFQIAANGDGTLVCRTANDTTIGNALNSISERVLAAAGGFPTSFQPTPGQRYAGAHICVAGNSPTYFGRQTFVSAASLALSPKIVGRIIAQADLPVSFTAAQIDNTSAGFGPYIHLAA